jgi:hypothetical protein
MVRVVPRHAEKIGKFLTAGWRLAVIIGSASGRNRRNFRGELLDERATFRRSSQGRLWPGIY